MSASQGGIQPPAEARHGTQVLYRWVEWLRQHGFPCATRVAVFRKGDARLVVHEYPSCCVVLKIIDVKPKIREFRDWQQPFAVVASKLVAKGWISASEDGIAKLKTGFISEWRQQYRHVATPYAGHTWQNVEDRKEVSHAH